MSITFYCSLLFLGNFLEDFSIFLRFPSQWERSSNVQLLLHLRRKFILIQIININIHSQKMFAEKCSSLLLLPLLTSSESSFMVLGSFGSNMGLVCTSILNRTSTLVSEPWTGSPDVEWDSKEHVKLNIYIFIIYILNHSNYLICLLF